MSLYALSLAARLGVFGTEAQAAALEAERVARDEGAGGEPLNADMDGPRVER